MVRRIDALQSGALATHDTERELDALNSAVDGGFDIARELIAFAGRSGQTGPVDLNALVTRTRGIIQRMLGPAIRLHLDLAQASPLARAELNHVEWVLLSLVLNGREAMEGRGTLTISTGSMDPQSTDARRVVGDGRWVRLALTDTGHAMRQTSGKPPAELFFSHKGGENDRLGFVNMLVRQMGGWVGSQNLEPFGSHIDIYFPAVGPTRR